MKQKPLLTVVTALVLLFASCKNKISSDLSIPKDAAFVFHINSSSLASKLSLEEIKSSGWFKEMYQNANDAYAQKLMNNPDSSGIDIRKDFAFFMQRRGSGSYGVFEGSVKDAAAFEALLKRMTSAEQTEKSGEWNLLSPDNSTVITWNNSRFAVITDMPMGNMNPMAQGMGMGETKRFGSDSLKVFIKEVMDTKSDNSLFDDKRFASLVKETGDMHIWTNSSPLYSDISGMLSMMKAGSLLTDNVSASTLVFDEGKITVSSKSYLNKEMQKLIEKWDSKKVETAVINRIPSENIIGVIAANVDPKSLQEFFKAVGFDGIINMMLAKQNISMNEMFAATKGQFVLAFSDLSMQNQTVTLPGDEGGEAYTYTKQNPDFNVLFATNVNQKPSFQNLLNALTANVPTPPFSYKLNDDWFAAANKTETVDGFLAGKGSNKAFADKISGHPIGMYFDMQRLLKTNFSNEPAARSMLSEAAATWQDVIATGGEMKDGAVIGEFVINMVDKKTNSLKQMNRFIEKMYQSSKQNKVVYQHAPQASDVIIDTAVAATPE